MCLVVGGFEFERKSVRLVLSLNVVHSCERQICGSFFLLLVLFSFLNDDEQQQHEKEEEEELKTTTLCVATLPKQSMS